MVRNKMKPSKKMLGILMLCFAIVGCQSERKSPDNSETKTSDNPETNELFPKGELTPAEYFTGKAWVYGLVEADSTYTTAVGSVTFEAGARSNWHSHPSGQILIVTDGVGYHQIEGQSKQTIRKGDVAKCPPNVPHWHGASQDSSMTHIYIAPNTERGVVEWMGPATDEEYTN